MTLPDPRTRRTAPLDVTTSIAVTEGIRVDVRSQYLADQSMPRQQRYVFAYTVRVRNEGTEPASLRSRHWVITDGNDKVEEVRGPGVIGRQPSLSPGEEFEYSSGCVLTTPRGEMHGEYQMVRQDGRSFDAAIAPFALVLPHSLN